MQPVRWEGDASHGSLMLIDQTALPATVLTLRMDSLAALCEAIATLRVRGAPAIGLAGAYGVVLAMQAHAMDTPECFATALRDAANQLAAVRPTARNLAWAVRRVEAHGLQCATASALESLNALLAEARNVENENASMCSSMSRHGAALLRADEGILTHCNAGPLATGGQGSALGVILEAHAWGLRPRVYADETRPLLQGARLTAFELDRAGIPVTVLCDSAAATLMARGMVQRVLVGADRIAANGDTANKIGTYALAVLARTHHIPFHVVAPSSTFDLELADGCGIPIEERNGDEVRTIAGQRCTPEGIAVFNPAFDVTPAVLITSIICERGVITPVAEDTIRRTLAPAS